MSISNVLFSNYLKESEDILKKKGKKKIEEIAHRSFIGLSLTFSYFYCEFTAHERCQIKNLQAEVIYTATDM